MEVIKYQTSHKESSVSQGRKNNSSVWEESGLQKAVTSGYICSSKITWLIIDTKLYNMKKITHTFHNRKRSIFCLEMSCWECWSTVLDKLTSENSSHIALFFLTRLLECWIYYGFKKKKKRRFLGWDFSSEKPAESVVRIVILNPSLQLSSHVVHMNVMWLTLSEKSHLKVEPESCFTVVSKLPRVSNFLAASYTAWSASKLL